MTAGAGGAVAVGGTGDGVGASVGEAVTVLVGSALGAVAAGGVGVGALTIARVGTAVGSGRRTEQAEISREIAAIKLNQRLTGFSSDTR
jgi:hypothetical protein